MAYFNIVNKHDPKIVSKSDYWKSVLNTEKYCFPDTPNQPTGKAAHAETENIKANMYKNNARMVAFRVANQDRLLTWLKCLSYRYHYQFGKEKEFKCEWIDRLKEGSNEAIDEITIRLS